MTKRVSHPPVAALLPLAADSAARPTGAEARHLEECSRCRADLTHLRVLAASVQNSAAEPPIDVLQRAYELIHIVPPRGSQSKLFLPARLIFDSKAAPALAAGRAPMPRWHQVWRTVPADVDVQLEGSGIGSKPELLGQILPRGRRQSPDAEGTAWLFEHGQLSSAATIWPSGEFILPAPRHARWDLCLAWGRLRLRINST